MRKILIFFVLIIFSGVTQVKAEVAKTASIKAVSATTSHLTDDTFSIQVFASDPSRAFTTFGASVATSNLQIISLTKGPDILNCTTTPTNSSLNFYCGVIGSTLNALVYTLQVKAIDAGSASINFSNCSIKSTDGVTVTEVCGGTTGLSFTITANTRPTATKKPTPTPKPGSKSVSTIVPTNTPIITTIEPTTTVEDTTSFRLTITLLSIYNEVLPNTKLIIDGKEYISDSLGKIEITSPISESSDLKIIENGIEISGKVLMAGKTIEINNGLKPIVSQQESPLGSNILIIITICLIPILLGLLFWLVKRRKSQNTEKNP